MYIYSINFLRNLKHIFIHSPIVICGAKAFSLHMAPLEFSFLIKPHPFCFIPDFQILLFGFVKVENKIILEFIDFLSNLLKLLHVQLF